MNDTPAKVGAASALQRVRQGISAPKPPRRNPFKEGSALAKQYDAMLKAYDVGERDLVRENKTVRCVGNGWADSFWLGYDGIAPARIPRQTYAWACYRAGQAQRLVDLQAGVFVPPKTNSVVKRS